MGRAARPPRSGPHRRPPRLRRPHRSLVPAPRRPRAVDGRSGLQPREPGAWYESWRALQAAATQIRRATQDVPRMRRWSEFMEVLEERCFGREPDRTRTIAAFERHVAEVKASIPRRAAAGLRGERRLGSPLRLPRSPGPGRPLSRTSTSASSSSGSLLRSPAATPRWPGASVRARCAYPARSQAKRPKRERAAPAGGCGAVGRRRSHGQGPGLPGQAQSSPALPSFLRWAWRAARLSSVAHTAASSSDCWRPWASIRANRLGDERCLGVGVGLARERTHARRASRDGRLEIGGGQQLVDDAEPDGLARGIEGRPERQLGGARVRQPQLDDLDGRLRVRRADRHLVEAELPVAVAAEAVVAGEHEDEPARDRVPGDARDRRLRKREQRPVRVAVELGHHDDRPGFASRRREVEAAAEEPARSGQHQGAYRGCLASAFDRGGEVAEQGLVDGVRRGGDRAPANGRHPADLLPLRSASGDPAITEVSFGVPSVHGPNAPIDPSRDSGLRRGDGALNRAPDSMPVRTGESRTNQPPQGLNDDCRDCMLHVAPEDTRHSSSDGDGASDHRCPAV